MRKNFFYINLDNKLELIIETFEKLSNHFCLKRLQNTLKSTLVKTKKLFLMTANAKKFSKYVINISILNMPSEGYKCSNLSEQDLILKILDKYKDHPSIKLIKAKNNSHAVRFIQTDIKEVKKSFQSLDQKKKA